MTPARTALDRYVRLEALGSWRERPGAAPREVVVSLGNATLVLTDLDERPLGHWALAGITRLGRDGEATVYSMTADAAETLAIRDADMIAAIAAVSRPASPRRARRARVPVLPLLGLAALAAAALAVPGLAARLVPLQAEEIGDRMLIALIERRGPVCAGPEGERALARLALRLDPAAPPRVRVMPLGAAPVALLPGGTVLLDRAALAGASGPDEVAGLVALARGRDAEGAVAASLGAGTAAAYLFSRQLGDRAVARAAEAALAPPSRGEAATAAILLAAAGLDGGPLLAGLDGDAPPVIDSALPAAGGSALGADDWTALRRICN